jgi:PAS domain S-box-containing protein
MNFPKGGQIKEIRNMRMPKNKSEKKQPFIPLKRPPDIHLKTLKKYHILDNISDGAYMINADGYFTFMNKALLERRAISSELYRDIHFLDLIDPEYHELANKNFQRTMRGEDGIPYELRSKNAGGRVMIVEVHSMPVLEGGKIVGLLGISRDITKRKLVEMALEESEKKFRLAAKHSSDLIWEWNIEQGELRWYGPIDKVLGYNDGEFPRTINAWKSIIHPDDRNRVMAALIQHLNSGTSYYQEYRVYQKDGTILYWTDRGSAVWDESNRPSKMIGAVADITQQMKAQEALQKSKKRYQALLENASDAILLSDAEGNLSEVNKNAERLLGYSRTELLSMNISMIHPKEQIDRIMDTFKDITEKGFSVIHDTRALRKDGKAVPIDITGSRVEYDGQIIVQGIFRDISERKQTETQLWESQERLRLALQAGKQGYFDWDIKKDEAYYSERCHELLGYPSNKTTLTSQLWNRLIHPKDKPAVLRELKNHLNGKIGHYEATHRMKGKSGEWKWIRVIAEVLNRDDTGSPLRMMGTVADVTPYKNLEAELEKRVAERTEELTEVNSALKVLLKHREHDKMEIEEKLIANLKFMVLPYLNQLIRSGLNIEQKKLLSLINENVQKISSSFIKNLNSKYSTLTPKELQIAEHIRSGKTSKEMAGMMNISPRTVDVLRYSIRKKLGLNNKKANLQSLLSSI